MRRVSGCSGSLYYLFVEDILIHAGMAWSYFMVLFLIYYTANNGYHLQSVQGTE